MPQNINQPIVYLTMYSGTKMPRWYIGSTTIDKINDGYNGSVDSKKYKAIWLEERKAHPELFKTRILSYHTTKQESLDEELRLHKKHSVIKNINYINMSYCQAKGFHGGDTSKFIDYSSQEYRDKLSEAGRGENNSCYGKVYTSKEKENSEFFKRNKKGKDNPNYGRKASNETKQKQSKSLSGSNNPNYGKCWCVPKDAVNKDIKKMFPKDSIPENWISVSEFNKKI